MSSGFINLILTLPSTIFVVFVEFILIINVVPTRKNMASMSGAWKV
ncbi:hypothetical protein SAMN02745887_00405 [Chitinimonas taiwanensis DSM 18899]|uniref:Uncharacterized protein n=1 Tax=Chitinimonas taiwanensis DSM 18899 TaxID=1121279 RepID=A0A1K2H4Z6_9NEIS|nr:hypothetical protein SAMN02745887_00405 [Chitinimonas taiwanensis DSM 18899]